MGLDTLAFVAKTGYDKCLDDEAREMFKVPEFLQNIIPYCTSTSHEYK